MDWPSRLLRTVSGMDWWLVIDVILALGVTIRLTRAITVEDIGGRLLRWPAQRWKERAPHADRWKREWWADALSCPFCVSVHVAWMTLLALVLIGGPGGGGMALTVWRILAAACTFSYISAHIMVALGDVSDDEDDLEDEPEPGPIAEK